MVLIFSIRSWVHFFLYLRILTLIVCLAYTYFTFGGIVSGSLFGYTFAQSDCLNEIAKLPDTTGAYSAIRAKGFIPFNCFYVYPSTILRVHLLVFASIAAVQILFRFAFLIRASARNTFGNLKALLRLGDFQVKIVIVCLAYALIVLDPTALYVCSILRCPGSVLDPGNITLISLERAPSPTLLRVGTSPASS